MVVPDQRCDLVIYRGSVKAHHKELAQLPKSKSQYERPSAARCVIAPRTYQNHPTAGDHLARLPWRTGQGSFNTLLANGALSERGHGAEK